MTKSFLNRWPAALLGTALFITQTGPVGAAPAKAPPAVDLFSFAAGAQFVSVPPDAILTEMDSSPLNLIDGSASTDWTGEAGRPAVFVLELAETTELGRIAFDAAFLNRDEKAPRAIMVEVSTTSPSSGYVTVLSTNLRMKADNQSFPFAPDKRPVGKWIRLTVNSNHGDEYSGFTGFRGYGRQLTQTATMPDVTGSYDGASGWGTVNIVQQGSAVSGCYEHQSGQFAGVIHGRRMILDAVEAGPDGDGTTRWRGVFGMSPDGRRIVGLMRGTADYQQKGYALYYSADRRSKRPGTCN